MRSPALLTPILASLYTLSKAQEAIVFVPSLRTVAVPSRTTTGVFSNLTLSRRMFGLKPPLALITIAFGTFLNPESRMVSA